MMPQTLQRATIVLLVVAASVALACEMMTRQFIYDASEGLARIVAEHEAAIATGKTSPEHRKTVLLVGNSLLMSDVDMQRVNESLRSDWRAVRFAIPQTTYYDWYFGLRRLVNEGARPDAVIVCFEPRHIVQTSVRNEIFAHYLMEKSDLLQVAHALDLGATDSTDLFVANVSSFYALRKEIRKNLLSRFMPDLPNLTALIARSASPQPEPAELSAVGTPRLSSLQQQVASADAKLMLLVAPPVRPDHVQTLERLGHDIGLPILAPIDDRQLDDSDYDADDYHLNAQGREQFTSALIPLLNKRLRQVDSARSQPASL